jgi:quinol monooxygenase YgiN
MVKLTAKNFIKAECVDDFLAIVKALVEKTNALDSGCILYELCRDKADPLQFIMIEEWKDQASLDKHMQAPHFLELIPKLHDMSSKPGEITFLEKIY